VFLGQLFEIVTLKLM